MTYDHEYSFHPFDEREFRDRFLPAVQGDETVVRELLDAADASGPSWTALHKMFDETRVAWLQAVEIDDGEAAQRTIFASFGRLLAHLRPVYVVRGFGLSLIDRAEFPDLTSFIKSPGTLLVDDGGRPLPGIGPNLPARVPGTCVPGRSGGGVVLKDDVRPMLAQLRGDMPRLAQWLESQGHPAEAALTLILNALVQAKLDGRALFEACDVLQGDQHLTKSHRLSFEKPAKLAPAVVREVARVFGKEAPPPAPKPKAEPKVEAAPAKTVDYSPALSYEVGQRLEHKSFGQGEVVRILDSRRLKVQFEDEERTLAQGLKKN